MDKSSSDKENCIADLSAEFEENRKPSGGGGYHHSGVGGGNQ